MVDLSFFFIRNPLLFWSTLCLTHDQTNIVVFLLTVSSFLDQKMSMHVCVIFTSSKNFNIWRITKWLQIGHCWHCSDVVYDRCDHHTVWRHIRTAVVWIHAKSWQSIWHADNIHGIKCLWCYTRKSGRQLVRCCASSANTCPWDKLFLIIFILALEAVSTNSLTW